MIRAIAALLVAAVVLCTASSALGQEKPSIERDLALIAKVMSGDVMQPGQTVETTLTLFNRCASRCAAASPAERASSRHGSRSRRSAEFARTGDPPFAQVDECRPPPAAPEAIDVVAQP